ncbi:flagellin [Pseudomonas flexibilis]|uniref:Flagellin n=1 Tax=Pseudomonas flexibilis TaxID=706570 RepID=A0A0B2DCK5_9PSED|nr:flagellin [Pseudomonas flexibilis]KHL70421.1 flagellin [Pseudomonas flexibilis]KHO63874.1 Lateral flagellin [Pseudomonas flexibilis]SCY24152.1 flagellin [Pseudomonas flexibilis]SIR17966.1 flagellin [Pseudomonas flexibilis]
MAISIHTNYAALLTQTNMAKSNSALGVSQQRLGTGFRVNSAADDAAGLQIATRLNAQGRGQAVAQRNAQDGISLLQTAEGALNEFTNIVLRMKDLATQAANGTNSASDLTALDAEYAELNAELTNIIDNTSYGATNNLFGASGKLAAAVELQIGSSSAETLSVDVSAELTAIDTALTAVSGSIASGGATARTMIGELDTLLTEVGAARGAMGANINRLNHTINNLANMADNTNTAMGRIMDTDFAAESTKMTKQNMLMQSSVAMLKQTSQMGGLALSLLG